VLVDPSLTPGRQRLIGRENCMDYLDYHWVGINATNFENGEPLADKGFILFNN